MWDGFSTHPGVPLAVIFGMKRLPKITEPITDNEERALREIHRPASVRHGGPSRAHPLKESRHSKKIGGTMPKVGGRRK